MIKKAKRNQGANNQPTQIEVRRDFAYDDSYNIMSAEPVQNWKATLRVQFEDEAGVDEGGLTKEWFTLLSK
jgi:hypothetical protein